MDIGRQLEDAVYLIEEGILKSFPSYEKDVFTIMPRKRVVVAGVRHEVDLWVSVDHGAGYKYFQAPEAGRVVEIAHGGYAFVPAPLPPAINYAYSVVCDQ